MYPAQLLESKGSNNACMKHKKIDKRRKKKNVNIISISIHKSLAKQREFKVFLIKQKSATNKMADYYLKFTKPNMEMAEQYRMGKNKEIFFVKQQEKRSRKIIFFFEHFFFGTKTMFVIIHPASTLKSDYRMNTQIDLQ